MPKSKPSAKKQTNKDPICEESCGNIFKDLGFDDEEAANLLVRSDLIFEIKHIIKERGWTQMQAAKALGVQQPRVSDLFQGQIGEFSVDMLMSWLSKLGYEVQVTLKQRDVA